MSASELVNERNKNGKGEYFVLNAPRGKSQEEEEWAEWFGMKRNTEIKTVKTHFDDF
jgi:hypothetical protein